MHDKSLIRPGDIATALALLTRLPIRAEFDRSAAAAWAYPLVGLAVGGIAAIPTALALAVGLPPVLAALIWLAVQVILTGAMHEDGLADSADGFWGGWDSSRRLEIMKDSHIGSYGVIALCLALAARWASISLILQGENWVWGLIAIGVLSRASMPVLMAALPHARKDGLSHAQGRPSPKTAGLAAVMGLVAVLIAAGWWGLFAALAVTLAATTCATIAQRKIRGQTGDVLGATQQLCEIAGLFVLSVSAS